MEKNREIKLFITDIFSVLFKRLLYGGICPLICTVLLFSNVRAQGAQDLVSLNLENATVIEAITQLNRLSGNSISFKREELEKETKRITSNFDNVSVISAVNSLLRGTQLEAVTHNDVILVVPVKIPQQPELNHVKGIVIDKDKNALPGVTILIKGTTVGTVSTTSGEFLLPTTQQDQITLLFSFMGMKTKEVKVDLKKNEQITVVLEDDIQSVDEVVVTGYQVLKEKSMAGSYAKISGDDLIITGNETIEQLLQGQLPGVMVMNQSGLTGTRQKVRVRGTSTLVGSADPVWVVDGIIQQDNLPFEASTLTSIGDDSMDMMRDFVGGAISWLNPNDIEDITVLKDASATAIYGVKAANGVIIITTKRGQRGTTTLNYSGSFSASARMNYKKQEMMNSKDRIALSREAFERGANILDEEIGYMGLALAYSRRQITAEEFNTGVKKLETMNTDWFDILYCTPITHSHSLSFSGGSEFATYRASFGYTNIQNTAKGNEQISYTGNLNITSTLWDKLILDASLSGSQIETKAFAEGVDPFGYALNTSRVIAAYEGDDYFYYGKDGYYYSILNELENSGNKNTTKSLNLNLNARWLVTDMLTFSGTLGGATSSYFAEMYFTERSNYIAKVRKYEFGQYGVLDDEFKDSPLPFGGLLYVDENRNFNYTGRAQLEFQNIFNGVHSVTIMGGFEIRSQKTNGYSQRNWGYQPDRGKTFSDVPIVTTETTYNIDGSVTTKDNPNDYARTKPTITDKLANYVSYYGTAYYMYDNRYAVNFSVRADASNRFGLDVKFQPIWSGGLKWSITDERWLKGQDMINNLALRATFGYQGNVAENVSPKLITKLGAVDSQTGEYVMTVSSLPNPELKWEKTSTVNLGIDFSLFKSKLNGTFEWYYKKTTDLISRREVPYENGTSGMYVNDGDLKNSGWELALNIVPIRTSNFLWSLGTTFSGNTNKVKTEVESTGDWRLAVNGNLNKEGYPVGAFWAFKFQGLNPDDGSPLIDFTRATTSRASEDASEYMVYVGTREPTFNTGINMMFRWKRFSLPLNIYISRGNHEFLSSPYQSNDKMMSEFQNASKELNERWKKPGDEEITNIPAIPFGPNARILYPFETLSNYIYRLEAWKYSDVRVVKAWYIRINDLRLSYTFPDHWVERFASNINVSFTVSNPLQIKSKDFKGRDPEVATGNQPRSQTYSFGINMSF